jgi:hypothetical protein
MAIDEFFLKNIEYIYLLYNIFMVKQIGEHNIVI